MDNLENIKKSAVKLLKKIKNTLKEQWQLATISGLTIIFVVLLCVVVIPNIHRSIQNKQVNALILKDIQSVKKVKGIEVDQLDQTISSNKEVLVALVNPNDPLYDVFVKAIKEEQKMAEFNGELLFYPVVYNQKKVTDFYQLKSGVTLLYFEHQKEQERLSLTEEAEISLYLVDHLKNMTRTTQSELERIKRDKEKTETATKQTESESEELIDELQQPITTEDSVTNQGE